MKFKYNLNNRTISKVTILLLSAVLFITAIFSNAISLIGLPLLILILSALLLPLQIELTDHFFQYTVKLTSILVFPVATVIFAQFLLNAPTVGLGINRILLGAIPCLIVELFLISLTSNIAISAIISSALWLLLATVNEYVFMFRGTEFMYSDFYGVRTAANVLGGYEFSIHNEIVVSWLALILLQTGILSFKFFPKSLRVKQRIVTAVLSVLLLVFLWFSTSNVSVERWGKEGSYINGYFLNFVTDLKNIFVAPPNNYSEQAIDALALEYNENDTVSTVSIDEYPDVVVIMSEAFTDFTVYGNNFNPREDALSFYHSLNENTVKGYALSSVFGGKTANSEYEFLTGNSTAFLPEGSIPFMQYINKDTWTIASYFASLGYETIGMHPYLSNGWNRENVYPLLGFERTMFLEDFPQEDLLRNYVTDDEMFDVITNELSTETQNRLPKFIFAVSVQNHGGYSKNNSAFYLDDSSQKMIIYDEKYPEVNEYLTLLDHTDNAFRAFIESLSHSERRTVVLIFGDHQPNIKSDFYDDMLYGYDASLDSIQMKYKVPFCIWANYEINEETIPCTSINYLGNYLFELSGIEKPPYFDFLSDIQQIIPAVNLNGYFSESSFEFLPVSSAEQKREKEAIELFSILAYNSLFSKEKNIFFFPATVRNVQ